MLYILLNSKLVPCSAYICVTCEYLIKLSPIFNSIKSYFAIALYDCVGRWIVTVLCPSRHYLSTPELRINWKCREFQDHFSQRMNNFIPFPPFQRPVVRGTKNISHLLAHSLFANYKVTEALKLKCFLLCRYLLSCFAIMLTNKFAFCCAKYLLDRHVSVNFIMLFITVCFNADVFLLAYWLKYLFF